jgi:MFS family permease
MYYVFIIFFSMIYFLFVFLTLREKVSFDKWETKSEAQMDSDMLVLDTLSCTIVALTMPAFLLGFASYGHYNRKALNGLFHDRFKSQERAILVATVLLGACTASMILLFSFDALAQLTVQKWVQAMANRGALGFVIYFFITNLTSELFCYFVVIKTV